MSIDEISKLIDDYMVFLDAKTENEFIMNIHLLLGNRGINSEVKQGWIVSNDILKAKLYITFCIGAFRYFILIQGGNNIVITNKIKTFVYKKKPSSKKIAKSIEKVYVQ